ncbi:type II toxin-antitoxin system VapC family toxin [Neorhizobium sp. CSC1952]|uniref:Predicted nucleic-acid-binding protein, contains PIN domain n=1 Tax=Xaviernesmea oryzae TaxID=464029 RepID=A0A1X7CTB3_9HYPH|nr:MULTISPECIES: type II toxin-antitoxin system VapC family toxin [Rhizobium/Agrobacterium group]WJR65771.1 type II toxin-antitoxin system VapC family toxin [Rhizobium sp. CSC1952]SMF02830.1 Predicted nucleic-acid-binding protein, contains PIN domain [Xaviernesmea oryzae]
MIGLDTNILARYILDDDPHWSQRVSQFLETQLSVQKPGYINPITLVELVWILRRKPGYNRTKLAAIVDGLLSSDVLVVGEAAAVEQALASFKVGSAGFADYLIAELNEAAGASPTITLDHRASKNPPFVLFSQEA